MSDTTSTPSDATTPSSEGSDKGRAGRCGGCRGGRGRSRFGRKIALLALVFAGVAGLKVAFAGGPHGRSDDGTVWSGAGRGLGCFGATDVGPDRAP